MPAFLANARDLHDMIPSSLLQCAVLRKNASVDWEAGDNRSLEVSPCTAAFSQSVAAVILFTARSPQRLWQAPKKDEGI